jgi:hypothetical protein
MNAGPADSSGADDPADVGRLLAWVARPREVPGRHDEYHRLVVRYHNDVEFQALVDAVFAGAGLDLIVDSRDGAVVAAEVDSPLRVTVTDIMARAQPHHRAVVGLVVLAIARMAYPEPGMVDDPDRLAVFTAQGVVDTLDRLAAAKAEEATGDAPADDDLVEAWRRWQDMSTARPEAQRRSVNDRYGIVNKVCRLLVEAGHLTPRGDTDGGTWTAKPRFRHAVARLCEDSDLYRQVNALTDGPEPPADDVDTGGSGDLEVNGSPGTGAPS